MLITVKALKHLLMQQSRASKQLFWKSYINVYNESIYHRQNFDFCNIFCNSLVSFKPISLCICVSVYLCICVSVYLCICVSVYLCVCVSVYLSIHLSVRQSIRSCVRPLVRPSVHPSICPSVHPSIDKLER